MDSQAQRYATREAEELVRAGTVQTLGYVRSMPGCLAPSPNASDGSASASGIDSHLWFGLSCYFTYRYVIAVGFLDGRAGLIYHLLQAFWFQCSSTPSISRSGATKLFADIVRRKQRCERSLNDYGSKDDRRVRGADDRSARSGARLLECRLLW